MLALRNAHERGQVIDPGLLTIAAPESEEREPIFLTWKQVLELASSMPVQISRIVPVAALTGAREGELFALRASGSNRRGQTKTRGSKRTIDLPPLATQLLREQLLARWHTANSSCSRRPRAACGTRTTSQRVCSIPQFRGRPRSIGASTS
jgi:hypothetical protein